MADALTLLLIGLLLVRLWQMGRAGVEVGDPGRGPADCPDRRESHGELTC